MTESFFFNKDRLGNLTIWLVTLLTFGFPLSALIPAYLGIINTTPFNFAFRGIYLALAIFLIVGGLKHKGSTKATPYVLSLIHI